ncbi:MAG TPA: hypothetical protein VHN79_04920, partial [Lacunisphaera sp.]|nr:hypothetical protein [Lacunisphaera sp.]
YPLDAVKMVVPTGTVTSVMNGNLLAGTNLTTPTPVTLGTVTTGLKVSWTYSAVRMDDGSGTAIILDVTATPTVFGQSAPTNARYIVARPDQVRTLFKDRTAIISQVLQQMYQYYYYTGGYGGGSTGTGTLYSLFPYIFWYNYQPYPGSVSVGPTTFINP